LTDPHAMNSHVASLLRHVATWIAGLTALILALPFMTPEDAPEVAGHVDAIGAGVVGLLAVMVTRALPWVWSMITKRFSQHDDGTQGGGTGGGPVSLLALCAVCAAMLLPSCAFLDDFEFGGQAVYQIGDGSKAGLRIGEDGKPVGFLRHAVIDPDTGEVTGWVEVEASRKVEASGK